MSPIRTIAAPLFAASLTLVSPALGQQSTGTALLGGGSFQHGELVDQQFNGGSGGNFGITISGIRFLGRDPATRIEEVASVVAFDTNIFQSTGVESSDPDLQFSTNEEEGEGPRVGWAGGNVPANTDLGTVLIIQENDEIDPATGLFTDPDDAADGGEYIFTFDEAFTYREISILSADLDEGTVDQYSIRFSGIGIDGTLVTQERSLGELVAEAGIVIDPGNAHINDFGTFNISEFDELVAAGVDRLTEARYIISAESGGAGLFTFTIPEPSTALLGLIGAAALLRRRR